MTAQQRHASNLLSLAIALLVAGCGEIAQPECLIGRSDSSSGYLVQLRPSGPLPSGCPPGQQYQVASAGRYSNYGSEDPATVVFQLGASMGSGGQASGKFTSFRMTAPSNVCTIASMTSAIDDSVTPVGALTPVGTATYTLSEVEVLADALHRGNQFQARALVDYDASGCLRLEYVAQGVFPITPCINDSICLPLPVATDVPPPAGRGYGSQLSEDYRAFCNMDPALLDNSEVTSVLSNLFGLNTGRGAYTDDAGVDHDVGICFLSEPFPSLCPQGTSLSTSGPCVVGPGSNPH
jgi:hypothetical protein